MKRPMQLVTIPVQETQSWFSPITGPEDVTYNYNFLYVAMPGINVEEIVQAAKKELNNRVIYDEEDEFRVEYKYEFGKTKVKEFKGRLTHWAFNDVKSERFCPYYSDMEEKVY